jgi:glycosyltransferase involved in cell wall biosynthesis
MCNFDVLVVPSLYEGCPSVILEAFSLNVPVLGSRAGGIPELLGHDELVFQPENYEELALKLRMLLDSDERHASIKQLVMNRKEKFTFNHVSAIEQLFLQCTDKAS